MSLDVVVGVLIAAGVVLVVAASWVLFRRNWFLAWLRGTGGLLLLGGALYMSLVATNMFRYQELSEDKPLATVSFTQKTAQHYLVVVSDGKDRRRQVELQGDLWQVDARILRFKGPLALLGARPLYQLERIGGRYFTIEDERSKPRSVHSLAEPGFIIDIWDSALGASLLFDGEYGSATYLPMADGAIFEVRLSESGLTAAPLNAPAQDSIKRWK